jgi:hypothetical protein
MYMSFFQDWGPLNVAMVYKACIYIHSLLIVSRFRSYSMHTPCTLRTEVRWSQNRAHYPAPPEPTTISSCVWMLLVLQSATNTATPLPGLPCRTTGLDVRYLFNDAHVPF